MFFHRWGRRGVVVALQGLFWFVYSIASAQSSNLNSWRMQQASVGPRPMLVSPWENVTFWLIVGTVIAALAGVVWLMWPKRGEHERSPIRAHLTTNGVFYKVHGRVIPILESQRILEDLLGDKTLDFELFGCHDDVAVTALGVEHCQILFSGQIRAGQAMILKLDELPDFPAQSLAVLGKVVKSAPSAVNGVVMTHANVRFMRASCRESFDTLTQYLQFLKQGSNLA